MNYSHIAGGRNPSSSRRRTDSAGAKFSQLSLLPNDNNESMNRAANHFMVDRKPKFILGLDGKVIHANTAAANLLERGVLSVTPHSLLTYGSQDVNKRIANIFTQLSSGRITCQRLISRLDTDDLAVFQFTLNVFDDTKEVCLSINQRGFCPNVALDAVAVAFNFTLTESEVVRHISEALSPKEIAYEMDITTNTVRAHLRSIYSKTGVRGYNGTLRLILQLLN